MSKKRSSLHEEEPMAYSGHEGKQESGLGLGSFKKEADPIAIGQAGPAGYKSDEKKIQSQMKDYSWD